MTTTFEIYIALEWLVTTLSNDGTLTALVPGGINRGSAPPGIATPYIIISHMSGIDAITLNAFRMYSEQLFQIKAVGPSTLSAQIGAAAARLDDLVGSPPESGTATGGLILASWRESPFWIDSLVNGVPWSEAGGMYRMQVEQH